MNPDEMKLDLPHITTRPKGGGGLRYYFRRRGQPAVRLPDEPLSPEFMKAYHAQLNRKAEPKSGYEGTFEWLCDQYMDCAGFKGLAKATRDARSRVIRSMINEPIDPKYPETFGREKAASFKAKHVRALRDRKFDVPNAANERIKILNQIFGMAVARGWRDDIPSRDVEKIVIKSDGHETATDAHIEQFFAYHAETMPVLAMRLLTAFGMRVSDLRKVGPQHVNDGVLVFVTEKTNMKCELPVPKELFTDLQPSGDLVFMKTTYGQAFRSKKAMSARVSKWFKQAGIEGITAHSVRKWLATRMAENGATEYELMSWFGWKDPKEARPYIQKVQRQKLAQTAAKATKFRG